MKNVINTGYALTLFALATVAAPTYAAKEKVYVSLGADVVKRLNQDRAIAFEHTPMSALARGDTAFATIAVDAQDIDKLSTFVHQKFGRCPGFFRHESAQQALNFSQNQMQKSAQVDYSIDNSATVYALLNEVGAEQILDTVNSLSSYHTRYYNSLTGADASQWILDKWQSIAAARADISVEFREHASWRQPSVIATIPGTIYPDEIVVIGGHLDSINVGNQQSGRAPGADDNASGIAVVTQTLDAIVTSNYRPERTVMLMGYAAEEVGLRGSQVIAQTFKEADKNVVGVAQFDMTGFHGEPSNDIVLVNDYTSAAQNTFMTQLMDAYLPDLNYAFAPCGYACSDHASWSSYGYNASFPFEAPFGKHNQLIHTTDDLAVDPDHAVKFLRLSVVYMAELAKGSTSDTLSFGALGFNQSEVSVDEGLPLTLTIARTGGKDGEVSIDYTTVDGDAVAGSNYTAVSGTLTWSDQDNSSKSITINTGDVSQNKAFSVVLSNPQGGVTLGSGDSVTVTIANKSVDNPAPDHPVEPVRASGGGALSLSCLALLLLGAVRRRW